MSRDCRTTQDWATMLAKPDSATMRCLREIYGDERTVAERLVLLRAVVDRHFRRFGNAPLRLFRSPGRINLRGMHVDTHGGYLNLMTHQRETVVAATPSGSQKSHMLNLDPRYPEFAWDASSQETQLSRHDEWTKTIADDAVQTEVKSRPGHWGNYLVGCDLRVRWAFPGMPFEGLNGVVGSDVPTGAALSSSAALCVAVVDAFVAWNHHTLDQAARILAARDAEWTAGSRCGVSDQAAMVLAGRNTLVNVALQARALDLSGAAHIIWPDDLAILVINSHTRRSISGAHLIEYTRNRFAYSLALPVLHHAMRTRGYAPVLLQTLDSLARLSPATLPELGNPSELYDLLAAVPLEMELEALERQYDLPDVRASYEHNFGMVPPAERPTRIQLRGPLLFGLAESERARLFPRLIAAGEYREAGRLMSVGHDGDRRVSPDGASFAFDISDSALAAYAAEGRPLRDCPGVYGASTPVLDTLVDTAVAAGALGASLTGAGLAGTVLALCRPESTKYVAEAIRRRLASSDYCALACRTEPLTDDEVEGAVVVNRSTFAAGEIILE